MEGFFLRDALLRTNEREPEKVLGGEAVEIMISFVSTRRLRPSFVIFEGEDSCSVREAFVMKLLDFVSRSSVAKYQLKPWEQKPLRENDAIERRVSSSSSCAG